MAGNPPKRFVGVYLKKISIQVVGNPKWLVGGAFFYPEVEGCCKQWAISQVSWYKCQHSMVIGQSVHPTVG